MKIFGYFITNKNIKEGGSMKSEMLKVYFCKNCIFYVNGIAQKEYFFIWFSFCEYLFDWTVGKGQRMKPLRKQKKRHLAAFFTDIKQVINFLLWYQSSLRS